MWSKNLIYKYSKNPLDHIDNKLVSMKCHKEM